MTSSTNQDTSSTAQGMAPATAWTPSNKLTPRKRRRMLRLGIAALALAAYVAGGWYFSSHFTPSTTVDGVDAGLMTTAELADALTQRAASYQQHITNADGFDATVSGADIALSCEGAHVAEEALARTSPALWLPYCLTSRHMLIDAQVSVDEEALAHVIDEAVNAYNEQAEPPTNATGTFSAEDDAFVATEESTGTALDAAKVTEACMTGIRALEGAVTLTDEALEQPAITRTNETLVASLDEANKIVNHGDVEVVCDGETVASIDRDTQISWFSFDDEQHYKIFGAGEWVENNKAIQEIGNCTDDEHVWQLDFQATVDDIHRVMERELDSKAEVKRIALETKPPVTPGAKERGRHIDINLTTQFVRMYDSDGTVIWDSYCVTGGWDPEFQEMHSTPTGTFAIQTKETNRTLVGIDSNNDGKPDYESFVNFWMPFLNYDYGLHDATWRYEFGGDIRSWWGSHGCVNLPYDKAEQLFGIVNVGDLVYVHYSDDNGASWAG